MELKIAILLTVLFSMTACVTIEKSSQCEQARRQYAQYGLNIDEFRTKPKTKEEFAKDALKLHGALFVHLDWSTYYNDSEVVRSSAVMACGTIDGSPENSSYAQSPDAYALSRIQTYADENRKIKKADDFVKKLDALKLQTSPYIGDALVRIISEKSIDVTDDAQVKPLLRQLMFASGMDISKTFTYEFPLKYPSLKGAMKEDAKDARKEYTQRAVSQAYDDLEYLVYLNPKLQDFFQTKIPVRLTSEASIAACNRLRAQFNKVDLETDDERGGKYHRWNCQKKIGVTEDQESSPSKLNREIIKDQSKRMEMVQFLAATVTTIELNRTAQDQVTIKMTIDWPKFFKDYKFQNISDLIEK